MLSEKNSLAKLIFRGFYLKKEDFDMSTFGDYKSYKLYAPAYPEWKNKRDLMEAKRLAYIEKHPEIVNKDDIQRGKILLRAIDIMDEHSQKKAENMEAATEPIITLGLEFAGFIGLGIGYLLGSIKPIGRFFARFVPKGNKYKRWIGKGIPAAIGFLAGAVAAFPLMAWGAKAEVSASRKGRFEAMRNELKNTNGFAVLTEEQILKTEQLAKEVVLEEDKKKKVSEKISGGLNSIKNMATDSKEYKAQKKQFEQELAEDEKNINQEMSEKEIENAKKDQQLLTKLVEKIDIASQDYAENSELATDGCTVIAGGFSGLAYFYTDKVLNALKIKSAKKISVIIKILSFSAFAITGILAAQINKQASRVGRYKVKKELMQNPNNFIYVSDEQANEIENAKITPSKKQNIFSFFISALKDNKEYKKHKKTIGKEERKFYKAAESLNLNEKQLEDAKRLQKNTFRTFNKVDENSQKYSESIEALGQSIAYPLNLIFTMIATAFAAPYLFKATQTKIDSTKNIMKYCGIVLLSTIPAMLINAHITKEQKKASRVADMKAINELNDYRKFK